MLARVCARLGIDAADVAAFGDMPNDLSHAQLGRAAVRRGQRAPCAAGARLSHGAAATPSPGSGGRSAGCWAEAAMHEVIRRLGRGALICLLPVLMALVRRRDHLPRRDDDPLASGDGRPRRLPAGRSGAAGRWRLLPAARTAAVPLPAVRRPAGRTRWRCCRVGLVQVGWTVAGALMIVAILHRWGLTGWRLSLWSTASGVRGRCRSARPSPSVSSASSWWPWSCSTWRPDRECSGRRLLPEGAADRGGRGAQADPDDLRALPAGGPEVAGRPHRDDRRRRADHARGDHPAAAPRWTSGAGWPTATPAWATA